MQVFINVLVIPLVSAGDHFAYGSNWKIRADGCEDSGIGDYFYDGEPFVLSSGEWGDEEYSTSFQDSSNGMVRSATRGWLSNCAQFVLEGKARPDIGDFVRVMNNRHSSWWGAGDVGKVSHRRPHSFHVRWSSGAVTIEKTHMWLERFKLLPGKPTARGSWKEVACHEGGGELKEEVTEQKVNSKSSGSNDQAEMSAAVENSLEVGGSVEEGFLGEGASVEGSASSSASLSGSYGHAWSSQIKSSDTYGTKKTVSCPVKKKKGNDVCLWQFMIAGRLSHGADYAWMSSDTKCTYLGRERPPGCPPGMDHDGSSGQCDLEGSRLFGFTGFKYKQSGPALIGVVFIALALLIAAVMIAFKIQKSSKRSFLNPQPEVLMAESCDEAAP